MNIFKYFKYKKEKDLCFCDNFIENMKFLKLKCGNHNKHWLLSFNISKNNFKILKKYGYIKEIGGLFSEYLDYRMNVGDIYNHPMYKDVGLDDDTVYTSFNFSNDVRHTLLTKNELLIKNIIE